MGRINRRDFIRDGALLGAGFMFQGFVARAVLAGSREHSSLRAGPGNGGYGPLRPVKSLNTDETLLELPEGFRYTVFGKVGSTMSDGRLTPGGHDGMAAFSVGTELRLVRNHELGPRVAGREVAIGGKTNAYDALAGGGTTTLVVDPVTRELVRDFVSLSGTLINCAGGPTPWGSWISCEETVLGKPVVRAYGGFEQSHGYCFDVPAAANDPVPPVALKDMGRFVHEAAAVDPATGIVYQTEDQGFSGFYRFIPRSRNRLADGGRLQMLGIKGKPGYDTRTGQKPGSALHAIWVDIDRPYPDDSATTPGFVYNQGLEAGGATFARLEGCWYADGAIFFTSTSGGNARLGQVWVYRPAGDLEGSLTLLFESPDAELLDMPDNLCVSPRGGVVLCEDGPGDQFIRGLTREGLIFDFAKNIVPVFSRSEFAGATFSPDGETLFFNLQSPGRTFAVWGPWKRGAL